MTGQTGLAPASPSERKPEAPPEHGQYRRADGRAPEPVREEQGIRDGAGVRSLQLAADTSARAEQIVILLPRADGRLDADELEDEVPPGRGAAQRERDDRCSEGGED